MTETSTYWGGTTTGDAGAYTDDVFATFVNLLLGHNADLDEPIYDYSGSNRSRAPLEVYENSPAGMSVLVYPGKVMAFGRIYENDAVLTLSVDSNATSDPRIDSVVWEIDWTAQTIRSKIVKGTAAVSPSAPTLTQSNGTLWQERVANIAVASGATSITDSEITEQRTPIYYRSGIHVPAGTLANWAGDISDLPDGWLACDGSEYAEATYVRLFAAIGSTYNTGGETANHFRVPDLVGVVPIGEGTATDSGTSFTRGASDGAETHTLTSDEMPTHTHDISTQAGGGNIATDGSDSFHTGASVDQGETRARGSGDPHNNMQPYLVVGGPIIKY